MFAVTTTLAMLVANSVAAPIGNVDMGALLNAVETDEDTGVKSLWFNYVADYGCSGCDRCGEVDAAPRMPQELFELKNIAKLAQYVSLTTELYTGVPGWTGGSLQLGRCRTRGYTSVQSAMDGVGWTTSALMGPICLKQCKCIGEGATWTPETADYPYCRDAPDDPKAGTWCSLCGPKYNSYIKIQLYNKGDDGGSGGSSQLGPHTSTGDGQQVIGLLDSCNEHSSKKRTCQKADGCAYDKKTKVCSRVEARLRRTEAEAARPSPQTIVQLAAATQDLSTLNAALQAADLIGILSGPGPFTVFAPSNEAFDKLPPLYLKLLLDPSNIKTLQQILLYHVVTGTEAFAKNLKNGEEIKTAQGEDVKVAVRKGLFKTTVQINNATVTNADVAASNGVVHIIDTVLMPQDLPPSPPPAGQTVAGVVQSNPELSTLFAALKAADLVTALSTPGPFTIFAPSNAAFAALPAGVLKNLLLPKNKAQLVKLLSFHVVGDAAITSTSLAKGITTTVDSLVPDETLGVFRPCTDRKCKKGSLVFVNGYRNASQCSYGNNLASCYEAAVTSKDNLAANGVVHVINNVLSFPDHLWFRTVNAQDECGQIDGASKVPEALFDPANTVELAEYVNVTIQYYGIVKLSTGTCNGIGYTKKQGFRQADWAPNAMMGPICARKCGCNYGTSKYLKWLQPCPDQPDDPSKGQFCSLCGPKYNILATNVALFSKPTPVLQPTLRE